MQNIYVSTSSYHKAQSTFEKLNQDTGYTFVPVAEEFHAAMASTAAQNIITILENGADACSNIVNR